MRYSRRDHLRSGPVPPGGRARDNPRRHAASAAVTPSAGHRLHGVGRRGRHARQTFLPFQGFGRYHGVMDDTNWAYAATRLRGLRAR